MTEPAIEPTEAPKPKRKYKRRKAAAKQHLKLVPKTSPYAGMTETACCTACCQEKCVITGIAFCGHPLKGGIQPALMGDPERMQRFADAKKILAGRKLDIAGY